MRGWPTEVRDWGLGPVDKSEGLGARLARALSIKVRGWGLGRPGPKYFEPTWWFATLLKLHTAMWHDSI